MTCRKVPGYAEASLKDNPSGFTARLAHRTTARMAESVDALVSNTSGREAVPVRPRLRVLVKEVII